MRRVIGAALALCLMCVSAKAQPFNNLRALGYQQLSSLSSAAGLTPPSGSVEAFVICTGQTVYWRDDGTAPTATIGMPLPINTPFPYTANLVAIKFIQTQASAVCNVSYFG